LHDFRLALAVLALPALVAGCSSPNRTAACASPCGTGLSCLTNADFPGGACTVACTGSCPTGEACVAMSTGSYCLRACSNSDECPLDLSCSVAGSAGNACVPVAQPALSGGSCSVPQLLSGGTAGPAAPPSSCQAPVATSSLPAAQVQELGTFSVHQQVAFNIPAGTASFAIVSQVESPSSAVAVLDFQGETVSNAPYGSPLLTPSGSTFFDFTRLNFGGSGSVPPDPTEVPLYSRIFINPAYTGALVFPNTSPGVALALDGGLPSGSWKLAVDDLARICPLVAGCDAGGAPAGRYHMTVLTRPGPIPAQGRLDLAIYLVTTSGPTAASAPSDAAVQRFARRLSALFAPAGICIGSITFYDVPGWAITQYASLNVGDAVDPCGSYRQLLTLVAPGSGAMALYFVDEIVDPASNGGITVGYDGAIPGPPTFSGTVAGGAVVSAADLESATGCSSAYAAVDCGSDLVATIAAHETGHFLGLFHTSDFQGITFDTLTDTPACVCSSCASPDNRTACADQPGAGGSTTQVDGTTCLRGTQLCGGADYLMFWQASTASRGLLSPDEGAVMRANPQVSGP
jgi:hypothetical protein